jgi:hypothetical protein
MPADPALFPPTVLREWLCECRAEGLTFAESWEDGVELATSHLPTSPHSPSHRIHWRNALRDTRPAWQRAYYRVGRASKLTTDLVETPDRHNGRLVA